MKFYHKPLDYDADSLFFNLAVQVIEMMFLPTIFVFGSVRSSRSHNLRSFVRPVQVCLRLSIFIILAQVSLRALSCLSFSSFSSSLTLLLVGQTEHKILRLVLI